MASIIDPSTPNWAIPDSTKMQSQTSQLEVYGADEETLVRLFKSKMKYALANAGFDQTAQDTVTSLVERNVISCGVPLSGVSTTGKIIETDLLQSQLQDMLSGGLRVNSNEAVLLILVDCRNQVPVNTLRAVKETSCAVVRDMFSIFPVRIYVARHPATGAQIAKRCDGFSLALLNVVNTDIGGPSMIQLLDSEAASPDWEKMVILTEAWNRTDLLWTSEELNRTDDHTQAAKSEKSVSSVEETTVNHNDNSGDESIYDAPIDTQSELQNSGLELGLMESTAQKSVIAIPDDSQRPEEPKISDESEQPDEAEHTAITELLAREANRPVIQHPTWEHAHSGESLIDLIRRQASTTSDL